MCIVVTRQLRDRVNSILEENGINYLRVGTVEVSGQRVLVNSKILSSTPEWLNLFNDKAIGGSSLGKTLNELVHGDTLVLQDQGNIFEFEIYNSNNIPEPPAEPPIIPPPFQYQQYALGTLGRHLSDAVDSRLPGKQKPIFLPDGQRNSNCWCDIDLTCISSWNSQLGNMGAGVAITKRHIVTCAHFPLNPGTTIRFIANDNQLVERTILSRVSHPQYTPHYPDISVNVLSTDLPDSIKPCKFLPTNWNTKLNNTQNGRPPCVVVDQEKKALVFDAWRFDNYSSMAIPEDVTRKTFNEKLIGGDSSSPFMFLINGELSLFSMATYPTSGTFLPPHITIINQMIVSVDSLAGISTGYQVNLNDISGFPNI